MEDSTAHDDEQNSPPKMNEERINPVRVPLIGKRSIRLLLALNCLLCIVIGLGFIMDTATIFPRTSVASPITGSAVSPQNSKAVDDAVPADEAPSKTEASIEVARHSGVSFPMRVFEFFQFFVLILIGVICGLISLGCLALISDRPFGDFMTGIIGISACLWLSALALFVPAPEPFLLDPIQYSAAGLLLWLASKWLLGLDGRIGLSFTGGTVAALGIMALGSRIVVWATWN